MATQASRHEAENVDPTCDRPERRRELPPPRMLASSFATEGFSATLIALITAILSLSPAAMSQSGQAPRFPRGTRDCPCFRWVGVAGWVSRGAMGGATGGGYAAPSAARRGQAVGIQPRKPPCVVRLLMQKCRRSSRHQHNTSG